MQLLSLLSLNVRHRTNDAASSKPSANYFAFSSCESARVFLASKVKADLRSWCWW